MYKLLQIFILLAILPVSTSASELNPFSINFDVSYSIAKGSMTLSLTKNAKGRYTLRSTTQAHGIAKLLVSKPITEIAEFDYVDQIIQPLNYKFDDGSERYDKDIDILYNWDTGQAILRSEEGPETRPIHQGVMDQFTMQAAAVAAVQSGLDTFSFQQMKPGRATERVTYTKLAEEQIETAIGKIDTLKYTNSEPDSDKQTYFWFAPEFGYAPVRTERTKLGKVVFKGLVTSLN